ncbi:filamentous hemagglutinin family N-terminal domain-containing protein [Pseudomonas asplenii]|uniref:Filamentous hemagglutinin family N-terminal domain-containing protein n=1 Tax=Pseudomonas asplenii TaxID=53407 RepID=A0A1H1XQ40_9PSED|nr:DUF637 domain-containing protein [Pseudomonas asplenii]SDT11387.1 filamentous hemagglutinin family N-terminal domain-containing protein [Pseudomonas asplenii]
MDVRQFAFLAGQPSSALKNRDQFLCLPKRGIAFLLVNVMFWQPLWAQADGIVVSAPGTTLGQAGNGVPIVNIAAPNANGLSHNQFHDYNVGSQGVILNNATGRTQSTQLGGIILGNSNLNGRAASTILNEVNGGSPSQLRGYTEVAGQSAHVIVANPYGISCNGCGFINTPRVTLSTGKAVIENGRVDHFQVDGGFIDIDGAGFKAGTVEQFDLITRSARINAEIYAKKLNVITGRNDVKADDLTAVARADDGSVAPELAIDSSALGGMYAGAIRLVGTEKGVGVRLAGNMATSAGDIQIDANGKLTMAQAIASEAVKVTTESLEAKGAIYAGSDLDIKTRGDLQSRQSLAAHDGIRLESGGQLVNSGSIDAGVNQDGSRNIEGDVTLLGKAVQNTGKVIASRKIDAKAEQTLDNRGGQLVSAETEVHAARIDNRLGLINASSGIAKVHAEEQLDNSDGKLLAGTDLLLTGGEILNRNGALIANSLTAEILSLDNSLKGRVSAESGTLKITSRQDLNNQGGRLQSTIGAVEVTTANLDNRDGVMVGEQVQVLADKGRIDNRNGQVLARRIELLAEEIDNREQGKVLAGSEGLKLTADRVLNQQGTLLAEGSQVSLLLNKGLLNNQGGSIKGSDIQLIAGDLDNRALNGQLGLVASLKGNLELTVDRVLNQEGLVESAGNLTVDGDSLDNSSGGQLRALKGDASHIALTGELNNQAGSIVVGGTTFGLTAASLNNNGGRIEHGGQGLFTLGIASLRGSQGRMTGLGAGDWKIGNVDGVGTWQLNGGLSYTSIQALTLATGERIASAGALKFDVASLSNAGELVSDNDLTLKLAGNLTNSGVISSLKTLDISAVDLSQTGGRLASGGDTRLTLQGTLENLGRLVADQALAIKAARINNHGTLGALGAVNLTAVNGVYNDKDSLLFSGADLRVRGDSLSNFYGDIYSKGDLSFAALDDSKASMFSNLSGSVESEGNIDLKAGELTNAKAEFEMSKGGAVSGSLSWVCGQHCGGHDSFKRGTITITKVFNEQAIKDSAAARLVAGKSFTAQADKIENRYSLMAANGDLTLTAGSLLNQGAVSRSGRNVIQIGTPGRIDTDYWDQMESYDVPAFNAAVAAGHFDEARFNELISRSSDGRFSLMSDVTTWSADGNTVYAATIQAGGKVSLNVAQNIQNGSLVDNTLAQLTGSMGDNQLGAKVGGIDIAVNASSPPSQAPKDVTRVEHVAADGSVEVSFVPADFSGSPFVSVDPTALPTFRLPQGDYGLFTQSRNPKGQYLIETNPQLTDLKSFFSSDYMLGQLGFDSQQAWRRLGDGGYETRLISDAVFAQTGQRFLANGLTSEYDQFRYLMDNGIASKDQLNLTVGVGLTSAQVASLTHDIVWMEERQVQGEKVLVPVLYLAKVDSRDIRGGSLVQGRDISVIAGNNLVSVGTLRASNDVSVIAGESVYNGGLMEAGQHFSMMAQDSIRNAMAGDIRGNQVSLTALNGDIVNDRTAILVSDGNGHRTILDDGGHISATSSLSMIAGQDLTNKSQISSGGDATLKAGRDINLLAVTDSSETHIIKNGGHKNTVTTHVKNLGSGVSAEGDLVLEAGQDINAVASTAKAGKDLEVSAGRDLTLASAEDEDSVDTRSKKGKKRIHELDSHTQQVASEFTAGGNLTAVAKQDVTLVASHLKSGGDVLVDAGNNLQLLAAQNTDHTLYDMKEKGGFGNLKLKHDEVTQVTNVGSQITTGGDLTLKSGGDQRYQVAQLQSGKDITLDSGGAIVFEGVKDLHDESHTKTNNNSFWNSAKGKGNTDETLRQTQMVAEGKITIKAVEGLKIDVKEVNQQSVSQTIDAMVKADPKLEWLKEAEKRGDVDWRQVKEIHESFKYNTSGLGPASQLIIAIIMAAVVGPAVMTAMAGSSPVLVAGVAAVSTSAATNASTSFINNGGNLGAVFKDVTSSDAMKGYAVSFATAGVTQSLGYSPDKIGFDLPSAQTVAMKVTADALIKTAVYGGSLKDNLASAATSTAISIGGAVGAGKIGDLGLDEGSLEKILLHAGLGGLLSKAMGGDFQTGAISGGVNEILLGLAGDKLMPKDLVEGTPEYIRAQANLMALSQIVGVLGAVASGGDSGQAATVAANATQYNFLGNHSQAVRDRARKEFDETKSIESARKLSSLEGADQRSDALLEKYHFDPASLSKAEMSELTAYLQVYGYEQQLKYGPEAAESSIKMLLENGPVPIREYPFAGTTEAKVAYADALREQDGVSVFNPFWSRDKTANELVYRDAQGYLRIDNEQQGLANIGTPALYAMSGPLGATVRIAAAANGVLQASYGVNQVIEGDTWNGVGNMVVGALGAASVKFPGTKTSVASNEIKGTTKGELIGPCCFAAGTMVATPSGDRAIDTLKVGDIVWSKPEKGGEPFAAAILATHVRTDQPIYRLKLESLHADGVAESETLLVTGGHPFYVPAQKGFVPVIDLRTGDLLQSLEDGASENVSTRVRSLELFQPEGKTFNLTVDVGHTFYVGKLKTWVHNVGPCDINRPATSAVSGAGLREDLAAQAGLPRDMVGNPISVWGKTIEQIKQALTMDGANATVSIKKNTSGNAQVYDIEGSATGIVKIQYSPSTIGRDVPPSQHNGEYYKLTYKDKSEIKVIDPMEYRPRFYGPDRPIIEPHVTYLNPMGQEVKFIPKTNMWVPK